MKKTASLLLILALVLSSVLFSCGEKNREYDEAEVLAAARELLPKAQIMNTVYYGKGISYIAGGGSYCEADPIHLSALGFDTVAGLMEKTEEVFTREYSESLFRDKISSLQVDGYVIELGRYYQSYYDAEMTEPQCIMVNKNMTVVFEDRMTYDYSTLRVLGSCGKTVILEIDVKVTDKDSNEKTKTLRINLVEQENGWRIDNPVFANY